MAPLLLRFHLQGLGGSLYALGWCPSATHTCPNRNKTTRHKPDGSEQTNANPTKNNLNCRTIYNEGDGADTFFKTLRKTTDSIDGYDFEIVCVDDGSSDDTLQRLKELADSDDRLLVLELSRNFGKESASLRESITPKLRRHPH